MGTYKRIVFCGPPHAGKSAVISSLQKIPVNTAEWKIGFVEEAATAILREGKVSTDDHVAFQKAVFERQLANEAAALELANSQAELECQNVLLILDRSVADIGVYLNQRERTLITLATDEELLRGYDCVFFFEVYNNAGTLKNGNEYRLESTQEEILALECRSKSVWSKHEKFYTVGSSFPDITTKALFVAELINGIIDGQQKVFLL